MVPLSLLADPHRVAVFIYSNAPFVDVPIRLAFGNVATSIRGRTHYKPPGPGML
jgi:hypothetical protein